MQKLKVQSAENLELSKVLSLLRSDYSFWGLATARNSVFLPSCFTQLHLFRKLLQVYSDVT